MHEAGDPHVLGQVLLQPMLGTVDQRVRVDFVRQQRQVGRLHGLADVDEHALRALRRDDRAAEALDHTHRLQQVGRRCACAQQPITFGEHRVQLQAHTRKAPAELGLEPPSCGGDATVEQVPA